MKAINGIKLITLSVILCLSMTSCKKWDPIEATIPSSNNVVTGILDANTTWTSDNIYELSGKVVVPAGITLTIEPGTIIKGRTGTNTLASALIVARGGKIMAEGTSAKPIIFTTVLDNIEKGQLSGTNLDETDLEKWGGVIILGKAPVSAENGDDVAQIEGIPATEIYGAYGGSDVADNSGIMKYVSIRHGGVLIGDGNEINGLTLGGVGNGTTMEFIEVVANLDDGIELFGGTVNVKNAIVSYAGDDSYDIDQNYAGTLENIVAIQGIRADEALELDGPEGSTYIDGLFTIRNGTFISLDDEAEAGDWKSKAQGTIDNVYFEGYAKWIKVRANFNSADNCVTKSDSYSYLVDDSKLVVRNATFMGVSDLADAVNAYTKATDCSSSLDDAAQAALDNIINSSSNSTDGKKGADESVFNGWSWSSANGKL